MSKLPIKIDDTEVEIQEFIDGDEHIVLIDERYYRVHHTAVGTHYFMTKIRGTPRSILSTPEKVREAIVRVHLAFKRYERTVQKRKEEAQRIRDAELNRIAEMYVS